MEIYIFLLSSSIFTMVMQQSGNPEPAEELTSVIIK